MQHLHLIREEIIRTLGMIDSRCYKNVTSISWTHYRVNEYVATRLSFRNSIINHRLDLFFNKLLTGDDRTYSNATSARTSVKLLWCDIYAIQLYTTTSDFFEKFLWTTSSSRWSLLMNLGLISIVHE